MFDTLTSVLALLVFLVPGFVWRSVEAQFIYLDKRLEWEKFALGLFARSTFICALSASTVYRGWKHEWLGRYPVGTTALLILIIVAFPAGMGFISGIIRQANVPAKCIKLLGFRTFEQHSIPTAWDYVFSTITPQWAVITLRDGAKLYGFIGGKSYFSSDPDWRDLYLSQVIRIGEGGKMEEVPNSGGVYISCDQLALIEFIKP